MVYSELLKLEVTKRPILQTQRLTSIRGLASSGREPEESGKFFGLFCLVTEERARGRGFFCLTLALPVGPLPWLVKFVFPSHPWLLLPHASGCMPAFAGAPGASLVPSPCARGSSAWVLPSPCGLCPIAMWQGPRARAPCLSSESLSLCARQELQGRG